MVNYLKLLVSYEHHLRFEGIDVVEVLLCELDAAFKPQIPNQLQLAPFDGAGCRVNCGHSFSLAQVFPLGVLNELFGKENLLLSDCFEFDLGS